VFRSRPQWRPAVSRLLLLVPAVGVLVVRSGVPLLSLTVLAVLLLGRSGRSAAVSVRAAAVPVLPLVLCLAVLLLSAGGLSEGEGCCGGGGLEARLCRGGSGWRGGGPTAAYASAWGSRAPGPCPAGEWSRHRRHPRR